MDDGWPEFELMVLACRQFGKWPFDPEVIEAYSNDYQRELLLASLKVKTDEQRILEVLYKEYPELLKNLTDRLGNVVLIGKTKKPTTMQKIYKDQKKKEKPQKMYNFPGSNQTVVIV